jgi:hypothetical protein
VTRDAGMKLSGIVFGRAVSLSIGKSLLIMTPMAKTDNGVASCLTLRLPYSEVRRDAIVIYFQNNKSANHFFYFTQFFFGT